MAELSDPRGLHRPQGPAGIVLSAFLFLSRCAGGCRPDPVTRSHVHRRAFLKQKSSLSRNP